MAIEPPPLTLHQAEDAARLLVAGLRLQGYGHSKRTLEPVFESRNPIQDKRSRGSSRPGTLKRIARILGIEKQ